MAKTALKDDFTIGNLVVNETKGIALLCMMEYNSYLFRNVATDAALNGNLDGCKSLGDYAQGILTYQLNYLKTMNRLRLV